MNRGSKVIAGPLSMGARIRSSMAVRRRARAGKSFDSFSISPAQAKAEIGDASELGDMLFEQGDRAVWKWTHYPAAYERELSHLRGTPVRVLELGVHRGGSLLAWKAYFGSTATVFGIDIDPASSEVDGEDDVHVRIGSQDDPKFLTSVVQEMEGVDLVIDDGSHQAAHQAASFRTLFPLLSDGGLYVVEDLHTSYWKEYGGGYRRDGGFIEVVKDLIDDIHGWHHLHPARLEAIQASHTVPSLAIYDSMVFVRKDVRTRPMNFKTAR